MTGKKMIIRYIFPPIPQRQFDYTAYWEKDEGTPHAGFGATEAEAIADLQRLDQERWEAELSGEYAP